MHTISSFILNARKCKQIYGERNCINSCLGEWAWKAAGRIDYKKVLRKLEGDEFVQYLDVVIVPRVYNCQSLSIEHFYYVQFVI